MKFMIMNVLPVSRAADVSAASDKVQREQPREGGPASGFLMMSVPFDIPPNSMVTFSISEQDSAEDIAARVYPLMLAGADVSIIPLLEVPIGGSVEAEKKYRG
jgi:hypothetical protein